MVGIVDENGDVDPTELRDAVVADLRGV